MLALRWIAVILVIGVILVIHNGWQFVGQVLRCVCGAPRRWRDVFLSGSHPAHQEDGKDWEADGGTFCDYYDSSDWGDSRQPAARRLCVWLCVALAAAPLAGCQSKSDAWPSSPRTRPVREGPAGIHRGAGGLSVVLSFLDATRCVHLETETTSLEVQGDNLQQAGALEHVPAIPRTQPRRHEESPAGI